MTWKVPFESNTLSVCAVAVPATSTIPDHLPFEGIQWLSTTLRVTSEGLSPASLCFCVRHFDAHIMFLIAPPSITACTRTFSPFGPCRCIHLWYTWLCLSLSVGSWSSTVFRQSVIGAGYDAMSSCSVRMTDLEKKDIMPLFPCSFFPSPPLLALSYGVIPF